MRWLHLLFLHWRLPAEVVQATLPAGLTVDTHDDMAWVGLVPFTMPLLRHRWWPRGVNLPRITEFHECNVRTYVRRNGEPGVWFYSLDAGSPINVWGARAVWNLPYYRARIRIVRINDQIEYTVQRRARSLDGRSPVLGTTWEIGDPLPPSEPGTLEHFLTERYVMFMQKRDGSFRRGRIEHQPWPLREATILELEDDLVAAAGFRDLDHMPIAHAADPIDVRAWAPEPC
ncbi:MAG: DUF2071 domain-containing protein [Planctomycetota bacterium]